MLLYEVSVTTNAGYYLALIIAAPDEANAKINAHRMVDAVARDGYDADETTAKTVNVEDVKQTS